ncbi:MULTISPECIES: acyltransferase family protein [unclassified Mesorhizobium]|uniref:Acyltransferase family protein n=1 Tax=Mesorhizobium salmacidum TaxID=3015171 RepID=A0ABU8L1Y2_9HYPH|nr:acyltransferase family protein [Mesorhizobium sp. WSM3626]
MYTIQQPPVTQDRSITSPSSTQQYFRTDIQALRALAVLLVVFYHARLGPFAAGYLGVDVFFVISGFLITGLIRTQLEQSRFSFWEFYYRRAKRLLPAAYAVIALTTIAAPFFLSEVGLREFRSQVLGALTFTANIALWLQSGYFAGAAETKPLLHVWSLAVEEQYYLLLPAFLVLIPKKWWLGGVSSLLVASWALCLYLASRDPSAAFYLLPTRFWELAIGSLGALLPTIPIVAAQLPKLRLPALTLLLFIPSLPIGYQHPVVDTALVCWATLILLLAPSADNVVVRGMAKIGDVSYSLYLIHWPVLVYVRTAWLGEPPALAIYAGLCSSFVASWALHRYVEEPFRRGFHTSCLRLTSGLVAASLLLGIWPSVAIKSNVDFDKIRQINYGLGRACDFRPGLPPQEIPKDCQTTDRPELLVWGDSFAMALVPGLAKTVGGAGLAQLTMSACPPAIGVASFIKGLVPSPYARAAEDCSQFNESVLGILKTRPEIKTVAISSSFDIAAYLKTDTPTERETSLAVAVEGIKALVEAVRGLGKRVVVVAPPPVGTFDIGECLERKARGSVLFGRHSGCNIDLSEYRRFRGLTLEFLNQVASKADVSVISYHDFLCDDTTCRTEIDGKFLYRDSGHLSYEGSEIIARQTRLAERVIGAAR